MHHGFDLKLQSPHAIELPPCHLHLLVLSGFLFSASSLLDDCLYHSHVYCDVGASLCFCHVYCLDAVSHHPYQICCLYNATQCLSHVFCAHDASQYLFHVCYLGGTSLYPFPFSHHPVLLALVNDWLHYFACLLYHYSWHLYLGAQRWQMNALHATLIHEHHLPPQTPYHTYNRQLQVHKSLWL